MASPWSIKSQKLMHNKDIFMVVHLWLEMFMTIINAKDTFMVIAATNRLQLFEPESEILGWIDQTTIVRTLKRYAS